MMDKSTLVIGASENPERYSNKAILSLQQHRHSVYAAGLKEGQVNGTVIFTNKPHIEGLHTVTLYIGPKHQAEWMPYILGLKPKRLIFNPGTENPESYAMAKSAGIECVEACTLVMLSIGNY